jgi:hypothetical protein
VGEKISQRQANEVVSFKNPAPEPHSFYKLELELDARNASKQHVPPSFAILGKTGFLAYIGLQPNALLV